MTYNLHPIIVHFPIALLVLYSFIKIVPFKKWFPSIAWRQVELVILLAGVLGAFAASSTGENAEHLVRPNRQIVHMHSFFASASTWIYGLLLAGEALAVINPKFALKYGNTSIFRLLVSLEKILTNKALSVLLALLGFVAITVTGLLGGVMVYGLTADPIAPFVLKILGLSI